MPTGLHHILRRAPTHFSALNEFGTLLTNMGAIDAACAVYSEAILHHPDHPMARVNLDEFIASRQQTRGSARALRRPCCGSIRITRRRIRDWARSCPTIGDRTGDAPSFFRRAFAAMRFPACRIAAPRRRSLCCKLVSSGGGNIPNRVAAGRLHLSDVGCRRRLSRSVRRAAAGIN